jgi:DNA-binding transcriptional LysR family regulator
MIDIRLKVFRSVATNLSFTKASQELFISQPAISKHIQELECEFNTRLFDRLGNKIQLTSAGKLLLDHSIRIMKDYQKLDFDMNAMQQQYRGELRIGASTTISQYVMPKILAAFLKTYPQIKVTMTSGNTRDIESALSSNRIDIGMVEGISHQPHLKYVPFMQDELVAIVRKENPLADNEEISVEELRTIPIVLRELGSGTLDVIEKFLHQHGCNISDLNIAMHFGSTEGIKNFVEHSDSLGIVSMRSVDKDLQSGRFSLVEIENMKMERNFMFVEKHGETSGMVNILKTFITKGYSP